MDPGWLLLFVFLVIESVVVGLLVMPVPSNTIRQVVISVPTRVWNQNSNVRMLSYVLLALDVFYFAQTYQKLYFNDKGTFEGLSCQAKIEFFRNQRNLYVTGFGVFLFFVMSRLLKIQGMLADTKSQLKSGKKSQ